MTTGRINQIIHNVSSEANSRIYSFGIRVTSTLLPWSMPGIDSQRHGLVAPIHRSQPYPGVQLAHKPLLAQGIRPGVQPAHKPLLAQGIRPGVQPAHKPLLAQGTGC